VPGAVSGPLEAPAYDRPVPGGDLRELMRNVPAAVAVVTVDVEGERLGLTVASVLSLSLDPPLVGVAIRRQAALHELLRGADSFGVSFLAADQERLAQHFARGVPPIGLWEGVPVRGGDGPPLLEGALGWLVCAKRLEQDAGDHTLFVGEATSVERGTGRGALVHVGQTYTAL
jgi:flavin reductase (DIM6/NTAB) family NADH-FMN oxidoreductase RutF